MRYVQRGSFAVVFCLLAGCGTVLNVQSKGGPPTPFGGCIPFGGVARSGATSLGLAVGAVAMTCAAAVCAGGAVIAAVDAPISLVGDVVTFPLTYSYWRGEPWAKEWINGGQPQGSEEPAAASSVEEDSPFLRVLRGDFPSPSLLPESNPPVTPAAPATPSHASAPAAGHP
jgi:hypothetical protein